MLASYSITFPSGGSATSLTAQKIIYPPGVVKQLFIIFPDGCSGQVRFRVRRSLHPLWPHEEGTWLLHNDYTFVVPEDLDLLEPPFELFLEGYNTDDKFPHTVYFLMVIFPVEQARPAGLASQLKDALLGLFRRPEGS